MNKKMLCFIVGIVFNFLFILNAQAANHFVRQGATGSGNGNDWNNAYISLPATLIRGDTYYIARGSYPGRTFNTAASGTSFITIKGATSVDHGIDTGWNNSYSVNVNDGGSQAIWTSNLIFNTSYWIFDGSAGPKWSRTPSEYGFKLSATNNVIQIFNLSSAITDITISHVTATAPSGDIEKMFLVTNNSTKSVNNVTYSHNLTNGWENTIWATSAGLLMNNWLVEYNVILNGWSSPTWHGEDINNNYGHLDNLIVRYNWFEGRNVGTGCIVVLNGPAGPYYIYGNVFKNMKGGDGIITGVHYKLTGLIYNNTFDHVDNGYNNGQWIGHDVGATVYNNVIYNSVAGIGGSFTGTHDYNAFFSTTYTPSEPHIQTGAGSPFVNAAGNDYRLTAATNPGIRISAPTIRNIVDNMTDIDGRVRGGDGNWDRGAFEFGGTAIPPVPAISPPSNLRL